MSRANKEVSLVIVEGIPGYHGSRNIVKRQIQELIDSGIASRIFDYHGCYANSSRKSGFRHDGARIRRMVKLPDSIQEDISDEAVLVGGDIEGRLYDTLVGILNMKKGRVVVHVPVDCTYAFVDSESGAPESALEIGRKNMRAFRRMKEAVATYGRTEHPTIEWVMRHGVPVMMFWNYKQMLRQYFGKEA